MKRAVISALIVAALTITAGAIYYDLSFNRPNGPSTCCVQLSGNVTQVNFTFKGASNCWTSIIGPGFGLPEGGSRLGFSQKLTYLGSDSQPSSCTIHSVEVTTAGFVFESANLPLVVARGTTENLTITVETPAAPPSYAAPLNVTANVTSP